MIKIYQLKVAAISAVLMISHSLFAQEEQPVLLPYNNGMLRHSGSDSHREAALAVPAVSICGIDTIRYPHYKEKDFSSPNDQFFIDAMVGNVRTASQAYYLSNEVRIKGVQFWGAAYSTSTAPQTLVSKVYLYEVDAQNQPIKALDSALVTITEKYQYYTALFDNPHVYGSNFAVGVKSVPNDTLAVMTNNAGAADQNPSYGEPLAWRRFGSGTWNSSVNFFGQSLEYMIFPIVEYDEPEVNFSSPASGCLGTSLSFTNSSSSLFGNSMFNLQAYDKKWHDKADTTFTWDFGDGSAKVKTIDASHSYTASGAYTVTLTATMKGYYSKCTISKTQEITIDLTSPQFSSCPSDVTIASPNYVYSIPTATDNCSSNVTVQRTAGLAPGSDFPEGETTITYQADDGNGNTSTCSFKVTLNTVTGIHSRVERINAIYPNPTSDYVNLEITNSGSSEITVEIVDLNGKVKQKLNYAPADSLKVDVSGLEKGIYSINVITEGSARTAKLVIK